MSPGQRPEINIDEVYRILQAEREADITAYGEGFDEALVAKVVSGIATPEEQESLARRAAQYQGVREMIEIVTETLNEAEQRDHPPTPVGSWLKSFARRAQQHAAVYVLAAGWLVALGLGIWQFAGKNDELVVAQADWDWSFVRKATRSANGEVGVVYSGEQVSLNLHIDTNLEHGSLYQIDRVEAVLIKPLERERHGLSVHWEDQFDDREGFEFIVLVLSERSAAELAQPSPTWITRDDIEQLQRLGASKDVAGAEALLHQAIQRTSLRGVKTVVNVRCFQHLSK